MLGRGQAELLEEDRRERVVVVLAGVDEHLLVLGAQPARDGRGLDELRAVADDGQDAHAGAAPSAQLGGHDLLERLRGLRVTRPGRGGQRAAVDRAHGLDLARRRGEERLARRARGRRAASRSCGLDRLDEPRGG